MNKILVYAAIILTSSLMYSQSTVIYNTGSSIDIGTGAEVCADTIIINGTYNGNGTFCNDPLAVENENNSGMPKEFSLSQNYPNPFNPSTTIAYQLPVSGQTTLKVYDILGNEVAVLVNGEKSAGVYEIHFNASNLASGIYFYKIQVNNSSKGYGNGFIETKKMQLLK